MTYYCEHGICPMQSKLPAKTDTVMVSQNIDFAKVASVCNLDIDMIRSLNPVYRKDIVPGYSTPSPLRLPLNDVSRFIDMEDSIYAMSGKREVKPVEVVVEEQPAPTRTSRAALRRKVKRGDTLGAIARRNGTTVAKVKRLNGMRGDGIRVGQRLRVK